MYTPRWERGLPAAFDFAVTSGPREDSLSDSAAGRSTHLTCYEDFKCAHLETKSACEQEATMMYVPMVIDACGGGWGGTAHKTWTKLAKYLSQDTSSPCALVSSCSAL